MAEFQEVMRQFDRMCKANAGCYNCPLHEPDGISDNCSIGAFVNGSERIEREVMDWAAEHPVVYPTWYEWLNHIGVLGTAAIGAGYVGERLCTMHIPADIAEKLGIQPKEG